MKRFFVLFFVILVCCCWRCNDRSTITLPVAVSGMGKVSLSLGKVPASVERVIALLSREGYENLTLQLTVSDSGQTASGSFTNVPAGTWHLRVDAINDSGAVQYTGQADINVQPAMTSVVRLQLLPAGGGGGNIDIEVSWGPACARVPEGLVSWWTADGIINDVIGPNPGKLENGASYASGIVGQAFNLDGVNDYVRIPDSPSLNPAGSITLDAWIYPTRDTRASIISKWGDLIEWADQRAYVFEIMPGRNLLFGICDSAHELDGGFHEFSTSGGVFNLSSWNHVAAVYDQTTGKRTIYSNGVKVAERIDPPIRISGSIADLTIGVDLRSPDTTYPYFFPGRIDEVDYFDRALTPAEIADIYNAGSFGKCR